MRTIRRDFSKFGNYGELAAQGNAIGFIKFNPGPIIQGREIGITVGAVSTAAPSDIYYSRNVSVTVSSASTTSFTFTTNPGHLFYPGTISFSAADTASGVRFEITAKGQLADTQARLPTILFQPTPRVTTAMDSRHSNTPRRIWRLSHTW
jgi:hypothetical protein